MYNSITAYYNLCKRSDKGQLSFIEISSYSNHSVIFLNFIICSNFISFFSNKNKLLFDIFEKFNYCNEAF